MKLFGLGKPRDLTEIDSIGKKLEEISEKIEHLTNHSNKFIKSRPQNINNPP